jgi:hypothetical protein
MSDMISMFIDNEMDINEKISFIEAVQKNRSFGNDALDFLRQEKLLRTDVVDRVPDISINTPFDWKQTVRRFFQPMGLAASGLAAALLFFIFFAPQPVPGPVTNRFVIYRPAVSQVEITGTFTGWERIPMQKIGNSGYWEISLNLTEGEHQFTYILEGQNFFPDPTIPTREMDDFGGVNSVLYVEKKA